MKEFKIDENLIGTIIQLMNIGVFNSVSYQQLKVIEKKLSELPQIENKEKKDK